MVEASIDGVTFSSCVAQCLANAELIAQFDRLSATNVAQRGSALELAIDRASGRHEADFLLFLDFCWSSIFLRFSTTEKNQ